MGIPGSANLMLLGGGAQAYEIEQSLRFESSAYLYRSPSSAGNQNVWTISLWAKRGQLGSQQDMYSAGTGGTDILYWTSNDQIAVDAPALSVLVSNDRFRDPSAWYHIVMAVDATNGTNSNRTRIYVNNREITSWATDGRGSLTSNKYLTNSTQRHTLGIRSSDLSSTPYKGYESEFYLIDGQQLTPSDFGEYDDNGVWRPKAYAGTYGTNGVYLTFDSAGIGNDSGTNGHNWSHTGFTTSGTGTDVMSDTPTTNYATLNPLDRFKATNGEFSPSLSEGNLKLAGNGPQGLGRSTIAMSSGKFYFEAVSTIDSDGMIGIYKIPFPTTSVYWQQATQATYYSGTGAVFYPSNSSVQTYSTWTTGDVIGVALDLDNGKVFFSKNGTWQGSSDPAAGTNPAVSGLTGEWTFGVANGGGSGNATANFGQRDFAYTPPTGFKALNTSNLPAPDIADGSQYFQTVLWDGDGATSRDITTNFSPDWAIIKQREDVYGFGTYDNVRGGGKFLRTDGPDTETTNPADGYVSAFNSTGVTLAKGSYGWNVNGSGYSYAGWFWDGGGTGSSNTAGSITSTVSANPSAGFSIISYTGKTYTGNASSDTGTVGHGLGVAPAFIIIKSRTSSSSWISYHQALGNTKYIEFDETNAASTNSSYQPWASTSPTSTVFTVGPYFPTYINDNKATIAYCFAEVEGYSKFSSYEGNGSSDGPFVYCGFRPSLVVIKAADNVGKWIVNDTARSPYNVTNNAFYFDDARAEESNGYASIDILSNGFKIRSNWSDFNTSGNTNIFMAFAENPFGGDGVSPAAAR